MGSTDRGHRLGQPATEPSPITRLRPLLAAAASTDLDDHVTWAALRMLAHEVTVDLAAHGQLPRHLTVARDDAPVVATRTIAAAWKHVTGTPQRRARCGCDQQTTRRPPAWPSPDAQPTRTSKLPSCTASSP